jgi:hypothetical protein
MRRAIATFGRLFRFKNSQRAAGKQRPRLQLEALEDRSLLSANASGVVSGVVYVDSNQNGVLDRGETTLPGVAVSLVGKSNQGAAVDVTATTDAGGNFTFQAVQPGSYSLTAATPSYLVGGPVSFSNLSAPDGIDVLSGISVGGGTSSAQDIGFQGLAAQYIGGGMFLNNPAGFSFGTGGSGTAMASVRANSAPVVKTGGIPEVFGIENGSNVVDLAGYFSDPDLGGQNGIAGTEVQFNTNQGTIYLTLNDATTPQTVANFLDYVEAGDYSNTIFNRFLSGQYLQGGAINLGGTT